MNIKTIVSVSILSFFTLVSPAIADHKGHDHASKPVANESVVASDVHVLAGEAVIVVHGIVCSFCSQGVTRNLSKLSFIDGSKYTKGVKVEIESQKVTIAIKSEDKLDLPKVFKSIKSGGYDPIEAYVSTADDGVIHYKAEDIQGSSE